MTRQTQRPRERPRVPLPVLKLALRLSQLTATPGAYEFVVVVADDGTRSSVALRL